jgi:hypothetical protein
MLESPATLPGGTANKDEILPPPPRPLLKSNVRFFLSPSAPDKSDGNTLRCLSRQ